MSFSSSSPRRRAALGKGLRMGLERPCTVALSVGLEERPTVRGNELDIVGEGAEEL